MPGIGSLLFRKFNRNPAAAPPAPDPVEPARSEVRPAEKSMALLPTALDVATAPRAKSQTAMLGACVAESFADAASRDLMAVDHCLIKREAFPDMRFLTVPQENWRGVILFSPQTQVATISTESAARTELIRAKIEREKQFERRPPGCNGSPRGTRPDRVGPERPSTPRKRSTRK